MPRRAKIAYRKGAEGNSVFSVPIDFNSKVPVANLTVPSIVDEQEKVAFLTAVRTSPTDLDKLKGGVNNWSAAVIDRIEITENILAAQYTVHECADYPDKELQHQNQSTGTMGQLPDGEYVPNQPTMVTRSGIEVLVHDNPNELRNLLKAAQEEAISTYVTAVRDALAYSFRGANKNYQGAQFTSMELRRANFSESNLENAVFENANLYEANFSNVKAYNTTFNRGQMGEGTSFESAELKHAKFSGVVAQVTERGGVNFTGANLENASFTTVLLPSSNFNSVRASNANFYYSSMESSSFRNADFSRVLFEGVNLINTDFLGATLNNAAFTTTNLTRAKFMHVNANNVTLSGSTLEETDFSNASLQGASFNNNTQIKNANFSFAHVEGASFAGATLEGVNFFSVQAENASFKGASIDQGTTFAGADLRGADFSGVDLKGVDFTGANLEGANFEGALLEGAIFTDCRNMHNTNFKNATFDHTTSFVNANLKDVKITPEQLHRTNYANATLPNKEDYTVFLDKEVLEKTKAAMKDLKEYRRTLGDKSDKSGDQLTQEKATAIATLYQDLKTQYKEMEHCINNNDIQGANKARKEFMDKLLDKKTNDIFAKSRDVSWKRIVGTIALSLTGVGLFVAAADIGYRALTGEHFLFGKTTTAKHVDKVQQALLQAKEEPKQKGGFGPGGSSGSR